jgi:hypothetical protein
MDNPHLSVGIFFVKIFGQTGQVGFCLEMVYDTLYDGGEIQTEFKSPPSVFVLCYENVDNFFYLNG